MAFIDCPYCDMALRVGDGVALAHLSKHGVVGRYGVHPGHWDLRYHCACGFEGNREEMERHWQNGDRKHAALCTIGDLDGARPFHLNPDMLSTPTTPKYRSIGVRP